ncbi:MAG: tRNA (guanosine(46)-N7)-methyltransferase TrmB [Proteobacteria bacterium]|nr:tRNA (guanosine(46)-N7)-methyltransferase TrmB [Pseudomonadota bacterium]
MIQYPNKLYGRKKGRRLSVSNKTLINYLLPKIEIKKSSIKKDLHILNDKIIKKKVFLEIGFGSGELIADQAFKSEDWYYFGVEPYLNGVVQLLKEIDKKQISNISLFLDDGLILLENLPENSVDMMAILFPDPWPKKKHKNRRFINLYSIQKISRVLKPNAKIILASDHWGSQNWILKNFIDSKLFKWNAEKSQDWKSNPFQWPETKYMKKGIASNNFPAWLLFNNYK